MGKLKYVLKRLTDMDYKELIKVVGRVHKKSHKNSIFLFFDIIKCGFKYGAGYRDYELYEFYDLTPYQRSTYIVRTTNNLLVRHLNNAEYYHFMVNKTEFNARYNEFLKRDWLDFKNSSKEDFIKFITGKESIIVKPNDACCGVGVEKITVSDYKSYDEIYDKLIAQNNCDLLEDYVIQHHDLSALYPHSVNTCRIMTLIKGDTVHIMYAALRIGNNGKVVDNLNNGGMIVPIDIQTGTIRFPAYDKNGNTYESHPMTGTKIIGFEIPYWQESIDMCKRAARITEQIRYCGWDVAIREDGPVFIEANQLPGYDAMQLPPHTPDKIGMLPKYRELLKDEFTI